MSHLIGSSGCSVVAVARYRLDDLKLRSRRMLTASVAVVVVLGSLSVAFSSMWSQNRMSALSGALSNGTRMATRVCVSVVRMVTQVCEDDARVFAGMRVSRLVSLLVSLRVSLRVSLCVSLRV